MHGFVTHDPCISFWPFLTNCYFFRANDFIITLRIDTNNLPLFSKYLLRFTPFDTTAFKQSGFSTFRYYFAAFSLKVAFVIAASAALPAATTSTGIV